MRNFTWLCTLVAALLVAVPAGALAAGSRPPAPIVAGYVFPHGQLDVSRIDAQRLTRVYYAFALIKDGVLVPGTPADTTNIPMVTALRRQNTKLQVMLSVGGWLGGGGFSDAALTAESRARFAQSVADFLTKYDLDGLDVDWEFPGQSGAGNVYRAEDKQNFTLLLGELRAHLDAAGRTMHRHLLLTIAAGAGEEYLAHTEMDRVARIVDQVNLMTYDFCEPDAKGTPACHHTALYGNPAHPNQDSVDEAVRLLEAAGVPAEKIVIGAAFYGHLWVAVAPENHGLYQTGQAAANSYISYDNIRNLLPDRGYTRYWDATAHAPYLYNDATRTFVSYDDRQSIADKCAYLRTQKLGGIMFWSYFDDSSGELLGAIDQALRPGR